VELGRMAGREVVCELTDMDQPLGRAVGNALEIGEALDTLEGTGPPDLTELVLGASAHLLSLSDLGVDVEEGRRLAEDAVADGSARELYDRWVQAQEGDPRREALPAAAVVQPVPAPASGRVQAIATTSVGQAALHLGAGRVRKEDAIDHAVGVVCVAKRGDAIEEISACYRIGDEEPERMPIVLDVLA
jgi:pyrimidine-nucleoside phosphorylase